MPIRPILVMRFLLAAALVLLATLTFMTGYRVGAAGREDPPFRPVCRPSYPAQAATHAEQPVVLFYGNSLLFDHGWHLPGVMVANCARQGLVATEAVAGLAALPDMAPKGVALAFGSVEARRARAADRPIDPEAFARAAEALTQKAQTMWPGTRIVWTTVPMLDPPPGVERPVRPEDISALNTVLADLATARPDIVLVDINSLLAGRVQPKASSYDGGHLTAPSYAEWEGALARYLAAAAY